jgi:hypothetical protein
MWSLRQRHHRFGRVVAVPSAAAVAAPPALTLRVAPPEDLSRIARLAALDSSRPPESPVLTAELDGEICAAVSLVDLHTVADPFRPTTQVRAITLARAQQLRQAGPVKRPWLRTFAARQRTADRSPRAHGAT